MKVKRVPRLKIDANSSRLPEESITAKGITIPQVMIAYNGVPLLEILLKVSGIIFFLDMENKTLDAPIIEAKITEVVVNKADIATNSSIKKLFVAIERAASTGAVERPNVSQFNKPIAIFIKLVVESEIKSKSL